MIRAKVKYLFIDFDGTLVDTVPLLYENYLSFLKKYGKNGSLEEFISLMGPAIAELIPILKKKHCLEDAEQELVLAYTKDLIKRYTDDAQLIKGAKAFLDFAKKQGLSMTLVTSSSWSLIEGGLKRLNLTSYFDHFVTGEKVKKTKPDSEIYLYALKIASASCANSLAIEDSYNGILSALGANLPTIAIQNAHLIKVPPQVKLVSNWADLLEKFKQGIL